ncbi:hypothetical protein VB715_11920 [Crocosphaera sp. UHCC 0190]|uniref:hypothetical protein n=1 Tax=Crocosphaera sp. UHCC 0190 TaxID=3110246 RepID=UPI002B1F5B23|nr:hypothetical protein [Crocosphaera sp. UHCC 0190]MEA5510473.1 hypothetical protein [Crocosphaera sp. UHCC 0190]
MRNPLRDFQVIKSYSLHIVLLKRRSLGWLQAAFFVGYQVEIEEWLILESQPLTVCQKGVAETVSGNLHATLKGFSRFVLVG